MIREADKEGAVTVCGGGSRARTVYVSKLNHVELQMVTDINNVANNYVFLFLYEGSFNGFDRAAAFLRDIDIAIRLSVCLFICP